MEGVGARLGRSSTRYGPTTVFNGPVRKWKKKWVHVSPPNASSNHHSQTSNNGSSSSNGNNGSHLLLYKWTPITQSHNNNNGDTKVSGKDDNATTATEVPPRRKFKLLCWKSKKMRLKNRFEDKAKQSETNLDAAEPTSKGVVFDEKSDINDVPMEESQAPEDNPLERQDLNESTLDFKFGFEGPEVE